MYPELEGKERQALVRKRWQALPDEKKHPYVIMSRVDRERAIYVNKLAQIRQNLLSELPNANQKDSAHPGILSIGDLARDSLVFEGLAMDTLVAKEEPRRKNLTDMIANSTVKRID